MRANRGGQIGEGIQLLHLASTCDRQHAGHGDLALVTAIAERDLPPLHGGTPHAFGTVIRRLDPLMMHEDEELPVVHEERGRQVAHVLVRAVQMVLAQRENLSLQREDRVDQLGPRKRRAAGRRIAAKAVPQAEQPGMKRQRAAAEALGAGGLREVEGARTFRLKCAQ